ncbi:kanamycin kinase [Motilibacter peucedani]|uniref:Kanamycin kinase n=1 Tax=Motilibacter peucedani TaxID=598650 RepID=A0A420XVK2_9ACTN|nr:aminoglycoside 3'-phosphotransferase [Motilibacter peucedani]RKS84291.1 kanamycin kinase [Motilibacter peucedani]
MDLPHGVAGEAPEGLEVPPALLRALPGETLHPVWLNQLGGRTFRAGDRFAKWMPAEHAAVIEREVARLRWAGQWLSVPRVLASGSDGGGGAWLVTAALPGESAVSARWKAEPARAAAGIGRGLRRLHDALPVEQCPFEWGVARRLARAGRPPDALGPPPPPDRLVVCHGDPCVPNTLLLPDGSVAGHVDLGSLGVADRWADLAVATWSLEWNYGPGLDDVLLDAYGVEADPVRTQWYRELWAAT